MKKILIDCDICGINCIGNISVYIFNETLIDAQFNKTQVGKEQHFCPDCTDKIKKAIIEIKDGHTGSNK